MPAVELTTEIAAPTERVFDLARSVELHTQSMAGSDEAVVGGIRSGLLEEEDVVTWRARHFGVPLTLTVEVVEVDEPHHFRDEMVRGPFSRMVHDHHFEAASEGTAMRDRFAFASPFGPLGRVVDRVYLGRYLRRLLRERNDVLRRVAESSEWRRYV